MAEPTPDTEVEEVLSAIRRLIVEGPPGGRRVPPSAPTPLVLTPALRLAPPDAPPPLLLGDPLPPPRLLLDEPLPPPPAPLILGAPLAPPPPDPEAPTPLLLTSPVTGPVPSWSQPADIPLTLSAPATPQPVPVAPAPELADLLSTLAASVPATAESLPVATPPAPAEITRLPFAPASSGEPAPFAAAPEPAEASPIPTFPAPPLDGLLASMPEPLGAPLILTSPVVAADEPSQALGADGALASEAPSANQSPGWDAAPAARPDIPGLASTSDPLDLGTGRAAESPAILVFELADLAGDTTAEEWPPQAPVTIPGDPGSPRADTEEEPVASFDAPEPLREPKAFFDAPGAGPLPISPDAPEPAPLPDRAAEVDAIAAVLALTSLDTSVEPDWPELRAARAPAPPAQADKLPPDPDAALLAAILGAAAPDRAEPPPAAELPSGPTLDAPLRDLVAALVREEVAREVAGLREVVLAELRAELAARS